MIERKLNKYIIPNILAMTGMSCYILADTFFISIAAGTKGITALNLALPVYGLLYALGSMIGIGSSIRYAICNSMRDKEARDYFSNSILWTLLLSMIFVLLGVTCPDRVMRLLGADASIRTLGTGYMQVVLCFSPCFMLNYTFTAFVRNDGSPRIAMAATLISSLFNIVFDYVLMFPMNMGMLGAALATGLSPIVSMGLCMFHYLSKRNTISFHWMIPSVHKLWTGCYLGIAAFVGEISSGITTMVFNFLLLDLAGNIGVAAYGVIANLALVGTAMLNGVSQGMQPLASEAYGKAAVAEENRIFRHAIKIAMILAGAMLVVIFLFTDQCISVFNREHSKELASLAHSGLRIYFVGFILAAVNIVRAGFCSATERGREASILAVSRGIVAIVVFAVILSRIWDITGVWLAFPVAELFTFGLSIVLKKWEQSEKVAWK